MNFPYLISADFQRIGLGTVQLGLPYGIANKAGKPDSIEAKAIFEKAQELNIDLLDTASAYGDSEKVIGELASEEFQVVSKWMDDPELALTRSLLHLNRFQLYGWLAHRSNDLLTNPHNWETMKRQKAEGKVQKIGFSVYEPNELELLLNSGMIPSLVQLPFNVLDARFYKWIKPLKIMGCEIHCRSIYLQGLFFVNPQELNNFFDPIKEWLCKLHEIAASKSSLISVLINSVLSHEEIDKIILGIDHHQQLSELAESLSVNSIKLPEIPFLPERIINPSQWPKKH